jgi:hypothetical protein
MSAGPDFHMKHLASLLIFAMSIILALSQGGTGTTPTVRYQTVTEMVAATVQNVPANSRLSALVTGRVTANDGGGGLFFFTPASVTATNLGIVFPSTGVAGRWIRQFDGEVFPEYFGSGDSAFQAGLDFLRTNGTTLKLQPKTYVLTSVKTLQSDSVNSPVQTWVIEGNGATLDFSASGLTSGSLLKIGATSAANVNERGFTAIRNLYILGPEPSNPIGVVTNTTTTVGLEVLNALDVRLDNILIRRCYKGLRTEFAFPVNATKVASMDNFIGLHCDGNSSLANWTGFAAQQCHYGILILTTDNTTRVSNQIFTTPRIESCLVGVHIDPLNQGDETGTRSICFDQMFSESITYDLFRLGLAWDFATPSVRGANRNRLLINTQITGGKWSTAWTATHRPIVFASNNTVSGGIFSIPSLFSDCVGTATNAWFQTLLDQGVFLTPDFYTPQGGTVYAPQRLNDNGGNHERLKTTIASNRITLAADTAGSGDDNISFSILPSGTGSIELNSNVGIGTNDPAATLVISGSTPVLRFQRAGVTPFAKIDGNSATGSLELHTDSTASGANTITEFKQDGNLYLFISTVGQNLGVGGFTAPLAKVAINGSLNVGAESDPGSGVISAISHIQTSVAGAGFRVKEGSNARMGTAVLDGGSPASVVVNNTSVTANTRIFLTGNADGGTVGFVRVSARTASTSFTITSSANGDTSTVAWLLMEPSP